MPHIEQRGTLHIGFLITKTPIGNEVPPVAVRYANDNGATAWVKQGCSDKGTRRVMFNRDELARDSLD